MIAELNANDLELVEDLLVEWERQHRDGNDCNLEELCAAVPHVLAEVKRRVLELQSTDWLFDTLHEETDAKEFKLPTTTLGEYQLVRRLGAGGMGVVYLALHRKLHKEVALKLMSHGRYVSPQMGARFEREMRVIGKLDHTNIVSAYDAGEIDGTQYLAMQYIDGTDVGQLLKQKHRLPIAEACEIIRQAALGLQYAHDCGVIHRDVKPSNLILGKDGVVKLLDVGLARFHENDEALASLTSDSNILGTIDFMPPEHCDHGGTVDTRSDLYSLGATLYKLLTGRAPLEQVQMNSTLKKLRALAVGDIPKLSTQSEFPPDLCALVDQMLAMQSSERPQSATIVAERLLPFCANGDLQALLATSSDRELAHAAHDNKPAQNAPRLLEKRIDGRQAFNRWLLTGLIGFAFILIAFALNTIRIATDRGTIVVKAGEGITVQLLEETGVRLVHSATGQTYRVTLEDMPLQSGEYQLHVDEEHSGLRFSTRSFSIGRGEATQLEVTLERSASETSPSHATALPLNVDPNAPKPVLLYDRTYSFETAFDARFTQDGKSLLLTGVTGAVVMVDALTGHEVKRLEGHQRYTRGIAVFQDGKTVIAGGQTGGVLLHDLESGKVIRRVREKGMATRSIHLAPDEQSAVISGNQGIELLDLKTGQKTSLRSGNSYQSDFAGDGKTIWGEAVRDGIYLFTLATNKAERLLALSNNENGHLLLHQPTKVAIFVMDSGKAKVFDLQTTQLIREFAVPKMDYIQAAFSHDGKLMAVSSRGKPVRIFEVATGKLQFELNFIGKSALTALHFSPDSSHLAAYNESARLAVWRMPVAPSADATGNVAP